MKKIEKFELMLLKAYLELPARKLLNHKFELEEDYIAEHVAGFIDGERFEENIDIFLEDDKKAINNIISQNINNADGKDLLTAVLLTKIVCNIMNKYKKC